MAVLAGLEKPARADVEDHLPDLLRVIAIERPSYDEALKTLIDATTHKIVDGELDPVAGASHIWMLWGYSREPGSGSAAWRDVRLFIGLASECENPGPHVRRYKADIVEEAQALLERGGLRITE